MLVVAVVTVFAALLLQVRTDERVAPLFFANLPLPPTCLSRECFGVKCPGCGLTRSFIDLAHGDWRASWIHHRLGWLLALTVLFQIPYRLLSLRRPTSPLFGSVLPRVYGFTLIAALIGNWVLEMTGH